jgi:hypothetical protein
MKSLLINLIAAIVLIGCNSANEEVINETPEQVPAETKTEIDKKRLISLVEQTWAFNPVENEMWYDLVGAIDGFSLTENPIYANGFKYNIEFYEYETTKKAQDALSTLSTADMLETADIFINRNWIMVAHKDGTEEIIKEIIQKFKDL